MTSVKYPKEGRGCFGVAMRKVVSGEFEGVKCLPFDYTGKTVVGPTKFNTLIRLEQARVVPLKGIWSAGQGYMKYGDQAREMTVQKLNNSDHIICVTDIMDHVISESKKVYAGTPQEHDFKIFHDGLSQWWEADAQKHMHEKGFKERQLQAEGDTNKGTRYEAKVVGDSPELCRGLDSHGFADLKRAINLGVALSCRYPIGDPRKFTLGTPKEVWSTMTRAWEVEPTSERIVEDIKAFPRVLQKIVNARGCIVKDEFLRTGRREVRSDGKGILRNKPRSRQRKATLTFPPIHPDHRQAYDEILAIAQANPA